MGAGRGIVYTVVKRLWPGCGERWTRFLEYSGLHHLEELVSPDQVLCPAIIRKLDEEDWKHNVHEDYRIFFFRDLEHLLRRAGEGPDRNVLALLEEPGEDFTPAMGPEEFRFLGFELLDVHGDLSILTNCGEWPDTFSRSELNRFGLLDDLSRARAIQAALPLEHPNEDHTRGNVWAVWRKASASLPGAAS